MKTANQLAQTMIGNYGMGDKLNVFYNENVESAQTPFLGRSLATGDKYSEKTKEMVDIESLNLVKDAYQEAQRLLMKHKQALLKLSHMLLRSNTMTGSSVVDILEDVFDYTEDFYDESGDLLPEFIDSSCVGDDCDA